MSTPAYTDFSKLSTIDKRETLKRLTGDAGAYDDFTKLAPSDRAVALNALLSQASKPVFKAKTQAQADAETIEERRKAVETAAKAVSSVVAYPVVQGGRFAENAFVKPQAQLIRAGLSDWRRAATLPNIGTLKQRLVGATPQSAAKGNAESELFSGAVPVLGPIAYDAAQAIQHGHNAAAVGDMALASVPELGGFVRGALVGDLGKEGAKATFQAALGPELAEATTLGERSGPGFTRTAEAFMANLPVSARRVGKFLDERNMKIVAHAQRLGDSINNNYTKQDVFGDVLKQQALEMQKAMEAKAGKDIDNVAKLMSNVDLGADDAVASGRLLSHTILRSAKETAAEGSALHEPIVAAAEEAGVKVPVNKELDAAVKWWRSDGQYTRNPLQGSLKQYFKSVIPFRELDNAASAATGGRVRDFWALPRGQQDTVLANIDRSNLLKSPGEAVANLHTGVQQLNKLTNGSISSAATTALHEGARSDFIAALPTDLRAHYLEATKFTKAQKELFSGALVTKILSEPNALLGKHVTSQMISNPDEAERVLNILQMRNTNVGTKALVSRTARVTGVATNNNNNLRTAALANIRGYTINELKATSDGDPNTMLEKLNDSKLGYKRILGDANTDMLQKHLQQSAVAYNALPEAAWRQFLKSATTTAEPSHVIDSLVGDNPRLADHYARLADAQSDAAIVKSQIGLQMYRHILDASTSNGRFGSADGMLDPLVLASKLDKTREQFSRFLTPDQQAGLDITSQAFKKFTLSSGQIQGRIGTYRTIMELGYIAGAVIVGRSLGMSLESVGALTAMPSIFLRISMSKVGARWIEQGLYKRDAQWIATGAILVAQQQAAGRREAATLMKEK